MVSVNRSPFCCSQGLPVPAVTAAAVAQAWMVPMNTPLSLPPMVIVTTSVSSERASTCGGTPGYCASV